MTEPWPEIPYEPWEETCEALLLWNQVVGKVRLANSPWINHSWHATLYPTARGLTTYLFGRGPTRFQLDFDLFEHQLVVATTDGRQAKRPLEAESVASFAAGVKTLLDDLGLPSRFDGAPNEVEDPVPFAEDHRPRPYDAEAVHRFFLALTHVDRVFHRFRSRFVGKCSPCHLFWGALDHVVTRFSGREAPEHPGGVPGLPDPVTRDAYSHEVSSAGFWPGNGGLGYPAFYCYAYPEPEGFGEAPVGPSEVFYEEEMGEFLLPYDAVRTAADPDGTLLAFLQTTYEAAADLAEWDREALERPEGPPERVQVGGSRP